MFIMSGFVDICLAQDPKEAIDSEASSESTPAPLNKEQETAGLRPKVTYEAADLRDPFKRYGEPETDQSAGAEKPTLPLLSVSGIIWGVAMPQAIINGKVVKIGDIIDEVKIIDINKDFISVVFSGRQYKLDSPASGENINKPGGGEQ